MRNWLLAVALLLPCSAFAQETADSGDTAWILTSTALVLFMTLPGLSFFYGGLVRSKNVLSVLMQCFAIACGASLIWLIAGYSLAFTEGNSFIGDLSKVFLDGVTKESLSGTIPEPLFFMFQLTFAVITPALMVGGFAERMKFSSVLIFALVWLVLVYLPVCHWVWGGGWLAEMGLLDFAGGTVVHITAGVGALVAALVIGNRNGFGSASLIPHNLTMTVGGAGMLWVGWFGFNGGSALSASENIGGIILNTHLSAAAGAGGAILLSALLQRPILLTTTVNGSLAGLVGITAGCATMEPPFAIVTGAVSGVIATLGQDLMLRWKLDDVVSAIPVHGFAGAWGTIAAGLFFAGDMFDAQRVATQAIGVIAAFLWAFPLSLLVFTLIRFVIGLRSSKEHEQMGLDCTEHNEVGYPEFQQNITFRQEP